MRFLITAGHDGKDPGAVWGALREADLMVRLRDILAQKLRALGHTVITDGTPGLNLPLVQAIALIPMSDLAIELHTNSFENPAARGVEVVSNVAQRGTAQLLARSISGVLNSPTRGQGGWISQESTARGRLGFVRAGGLVVETFFLSNAQDRDAYIEKFWVLASAMALTLDTLARAK